MYLVYRNETFVKLFFLVSVTGLLLYFALAFYSFHTTYSTVVSQGPRYQDNFSGNSPTDTHIRDLKYVLIWTNNDDNYLQDEGKVPFIENECPDLNCYLTTNKSILNGDYIYFDAIIFNLSILTRWQPGFLPKRRQLRQKYVFYAKLPSADHPICNVNANNYFNWTWTYKIDSDIFSPFIEVQNLEGEVIAPRSDTKWMDSVKPLQRNAVSIYESNTNILENVKKKKALVCVMDNCDCGNIPNINYFVTILKQFLEEYSLVFDIFGCHYKECPREGCLEVVRRDYYFYLVYEGSISKDYVTDDVLKAYDQNVVPIVYGGADYTKFLPKGSYINAKDFSVEKLASFIAYILKSSDRYRAYFQWKTEYSIHRAYDRGLCKLCALLNDKEKFVSFSSYVDFREWWYQGSLREKCLPKDEKKYSEDLWYINSSENIS